MKPRSMDRGIIGIVGGMGPLAGIDLSKKIINQTLAGKDQEHLPQILYSYPEIIGDRTEYVLGKIKENPAKNLAEIILKLESMGCTIAGLSCNTAHVPQIFNIIQDILNRKKSTIKLLHIVDEVGAFIKKYFPEVTNVGILGTTGTYVTKLYDKISDWGLNPINIKPGEQEKVHESIYHPDYGIKSTSDNISEEAKGILSRAVNSLIKQDAQLIILGCTEIPLAFNNTTYKGISLIDANLVFARALINAHSPHKLKPWQP